MRPLLPFALLVLLSAGCTSATQSLACQQLISCANAVGAENVAELARQYGPDSACWKGTQAQAEDCTSQCLRSLSEAHQAAPDVSACGTSVSPGPDGGGNDGGPRDGGSNHPDCSSIPKTQGVSQPCCPNWGIDACGANLFCAAYDGRTQATCYAEHSRAAMSECHADSECVSSSCNPTSNKCRSLYGQTCDVASGCAPAGSTKYVCIEASCVATNGRPGSPCNAGGDCASGQCRDSLCVNSFGRPGEYGDPCATNEDCRYDCNLDGYPLCFKPDGTLDQSHTECPCPASDTCRAWCQ